MRTLILLLLLPCAASAQIFNHSKGVGSAVNNVSMTIKNFGASSGIAAPPPGTIAHFVGVDSGTVNSRVTFEIYNNGGVQGAAITTRRARGQYNDPEPLNANDIIGVFNAMPYKGSRFNQQSTASIALRAEENMTDNSAASFIDFLTTASGDTFNTSKMKIRGNGQVQIVSLSAPGFVQTDGSGNLSTAALTSAQIATVLGGTPLKASDTTAMLANYVRSSTLSSYATTASVMSLLGSYATKTFFSAGTGISYNPGTGVITNTAPDQTVTLTAGNGITVTGTYPSFTISAYQPTANYPTRATNTNFTISATKKAFVAYSVKCQVTNPLLVGTSTATAYLEYSTDGGTNWLNPTITENSSGVGITVTVQLTNAQTGVLSGEIPVNALVRIRAVTSGTAAVTVSKSYELY